MAALVRCIDSAGAILGEGPVWVPSQLALYWVDIHGRRIHRYDAATGTSGNTRTPLRVTSLAPRSSGGFVAGSEHGLLSIDRRLTRFDVIADPEAHLAGNRFNDGKLDRQGRFWAGTMDDAEQAAAGCLYRLDADLQWSLHDKGYWVPNGPAFSPDGTIMYHTDSASRVVYRFALTPSGELRDKAAFATFSKEEGHPDGMTVDEEGCLWIAFWDGWCVRQLSPSSEVLRTIEMPVQRPTSCAFGGEALDILFVTSARVGLAPIALQQQPGAGGLFSLQGLARGVPTPEFAG